MRLRLLLFSALVAAVVGAACAAAATREDPQFRPTPADTAAARASLLRASDLGAEWAGGPKKPDRPQGLDCATYHAKQADLVVTGIADAEFTHASDALNLQSEIQVMKTAQMMRLDFTRTVRPEAVRCAAAAFEKAAGTGTKVLSTARLPFPRLGAVSAAYRLVVEVTQGQQKVRLVIDIVAVGVRRTEISLIALGPAQAQATLAAAERRLARVLVARARP